MEDSKIIYTKTFEITKSNSITIQISNFKWKDWLNIYKSSFSDRYTGIVKNNSIAFSLENSQMLFEIIKNIWSDYELKEYWQIGRYKVFISNYNGNNNFQIREWVISDSYTWFWKKWISISIEKIKEFKENFEIVLDEFNNYIKNWVNLNIMKTIPITYQIESYF